MDPLDIMEGGIPSLLDGKEKMLPRGKLDDDKTYVYHLNEKFKHY